MARDCEAEDPLLEDADVGAREGAARDDEAFGVTRRRFDI